MAPVKMGYTRHLVMILFVFLCMETNAKLSDNRTNENNSAEVKSVPPPKKFQNEGALLFADEFKLTLERYLFGICPQSYKLRWSQMPLGVKSKNITATSCDLDTEQQELAGRLATLALRAHTASRSDCARLGAVLANTLGELAQTAANRQALANAASKEEKKRKLSKSQKLKIQAKQRTALAVKKKAAALAAAAAAKMTS